MISTNQMNKEGLQKLVAEHAKIIQRLENVIKSQAESITKHQLKVDSQDEEIRAGNEMLKARSFQLENVEFDFITLSRALKTIQAVTEGICLIDDDVRHTISLSVRA